MPASFIAVCEMLSESLNDSVEPSSYKRALYFTILLLVSLADDFVQQPKRRFN